MPPEGGYRKFNWNRTLPKILWRPGVAVGVAAVCTLYGSVEMLDKRMKRFSAKFEDVDCQSAMEPFLTAERDRSWLRVLKKNRDLENQVMANVKGWQTGTWYGEPVFFTLGDKWWDPIAYEVFAHSDNHTRTRDLTWQHHSEIGAPKFYDKYLPEIVKKYVW